MGFALRGTVTCCEDAGRLFFLDIARDKYFCLRTEQEGAFRRLAAGQRLSDHDEIVLGRLVSTGILEYRPGASPIELRSPIAQANSSALAEMADARGTEIISMLWEVVVARIHLQFRPLDRILEGIWHDKLRLVRSGRSESPASIRAVAGALAKADVLLSGHDHCLQRAIAVMRFLIRRGYSADMVFGVSGRPFHAHCWVQTKDMVVTDIPERVSLFTPILVL